jgi:hypothetical protein
MRNSTLMTLLLGLLSVAQPQVREVWRYTYTPSDPNLLARLERMVRLNDGGWLLLGWTETPLSGQDALAIRLLPNGTPAWIFQRDGVGFDDALVDAVQVRNWQGESFYLLGLFTDDGGYLQTRLLRLDSNGQLQDERILPRAPQTHLRPLRLVPRSDSQPAAILTETITDGRSETVVTYHDGFTRTYPVRPWHTMIGARREYENEPPAFFFGTFATPLRGWDVYLAGVMFGAINSYGGPAGGFDVPLLSAWVGRWENGDAGVLAVIQSQGGYTGEDIVLLRYNFVLGLHWGYRYTDTIHDDLPLSLAVDARGVAYLLAQTRLWVGEPFEQWVLRLLKFSPQGALLTDLPLNIGRTPTDRSPLSGIVRLNSAGQLFLAAHNPSYLARLAQNGQPLWVRTPSLRFTDLFAENDGSIVVAGEEVVRLDYNQNQLQLTVIKYAPDGDVNGDGCVNDADLLSVLFAFGQTGSDLLTDMNGDGIVDDADLLTVLFAFGQGC